MSAPTPTFADVEFIGELGLGKSVLTGDECKHPPLRPGYAKRGEGAVEHHPAQPRNVVNEVAQLEIPVGQVDHVN